MRIRSVLVVAAAAALTAAAAATAAPDQKVALTSASPQFNWDGSQGQYSYFHVGPVGEYDPAQCSKDADTYCDQILVEVRSGAPVKMEASLTEFSSGAADFDLYVYKSDASGAPGEQVDSASWSVSNPHGYGGPSGQEEFFAAEEVEPGFYLLVAAHFYNPNATYKGMVKVIGATPVAGAAAPSTGPVTTEPAPVVTGSPQPAPAAAQSALALKVPATLGSARKASRKRSLTFKATAGVNISRLKLTLYDARKKVVGRAAVASFAKGSRTIRMKVRKLKAGRYTLTAEGTVAGAKQVVARTVKIKK